MKNKILFFVLQFKWKPKSMLLYKQNHFWMAKVITMNFEINHAVNLFLSLSLINFYFPKMRVFPHFLNIFAALRCTWDCFNVDLCRNQFRKYYFRDLYLMHWYQAFLSFEFCKVSKMMIFQILERRKDKKMFVLLINVLNATSTKV